MALGDDEMVQRKLRGNNASTLSSQESRSCVRNSDKLRRFMTGYTVRKVKDKREQEYLSRNWGRCRERRRESTGAEWRKEL